MTIRLKLGLAMLLMGAMASAQLPEIPEKSGPVTRQTAVRDTPLLDFEYSWPEAISPETALVAKLSADLSKSYDDALAAARENKSDTEKYNAPFNQNMFHRAWALEGQTRRLTSLVSATDTFPGGAHPTHVSSALLWDRVAASEIKLADLFEATGALDSAIKPAFCEALDAERAKRRQGEKLEGQFAECPALSELTIAPVDKDGDGKFEAIRLVADPYVAGPYAEGDYEVILPVTAAFASGLKAEFRPDFDS